MDSWSSACLFDVTYIPFCFLVFLTRFDFLLFLEHDPLSLYPLQDLCNYYCHCLKNPSPTSLHHFILLQKYFMDHLIWNAPPSYPAEFFLHISLHIALSSLPLRKQPLWWAGCCLFITLSQDQCWYREGCSMNIFSGNKWLFVLIVCFKQLLHKELENPYAKK